MFTHSIEAVSIQNAAIKSIIRKIQYENKYVKREKRQTAQQKWIWLSACPICFNKNALSNGIRFHIFLPTDKNVHSSAQYILPFFYCRFLNKIYTNACMKLFAGVICCFAPSFLLVNGPKTKTYRKRKHSLCISYAPFIIYEWAISFKRDINCHILYCIAYEYYL